MRVVISSAMLVLVGCSAEGGIFKNSADLQGVNMAGQMNAFTANTRDGWGVAKTWNDSLFRRQGFSVNIMGEGDGVLMTQVKFKDVQFSDLHPGDRIDFSSDADNSDVRVNLMGCGGEEEYDWEYDNFDGVGWLEVIDRSNDSVTLNLDVLFDGEEGSWVQAQMTLPGELNDRDIEDVDQ